MEYALDSLGFDGCTLTIRGTSVGSDIKWNNMYADVQVRNKDGWTLECEISAFTHNCGVKSIARLYPGGAPDNIKITKALWPILESLLCHKTNCSMVLASDGASGGMTPVLKAIGFEPIFGPMHNPNYGRGGNHPIFLFGKNILGAYSADLQKKWDALCTGNLQDAAPSHEYYSGSTFN